MRAEYDFVAAAHARGSKSDLESICSIAYTQDEPRAQELTERTLEMLEVTLFDKCTAAADVHEDVDKLNLVRSKEARIVEKLNGANCR